MPNELLISIASLKHRKHTDQKHFAQSTDFIIQAQSLTLEGVSSNPVGIQGSPSLAYITFLYRFQPTHREVCKLDIMAVKA